MRVTKIRLIAAAAIVASLSLSGCGLIGDYSKVEAEDMTALFGDQPAVTSVETNCTANLPGWFACSVTLIVEPEITPVELESLVQFAIDNPVDSEIDVSLDGSVEGYQSLSLGRDDALAGLTEPDRIAAGFLMASRFPGAYIIDYEADRDRLTADYPAADDLTLLKQAQLIDAALPPTDATVTSDLFEVDWKAGAYPVQEARLFASVAGEFVTSGGSVKSENVAIIVYGVAAQAQEYAASLDGFADINLVSIGDGTDIDYSDVSVDKAKAAGIVLDAAKNVDGFTSAEASGSILTINLELPTDIRAADATLTAIPEYADFGIRYNTGEASAFREPGGYLPVDEIESLYASGYFEDIEFGIYKDKLSLLVRSHVPTDPADIGFALADAGLAAFDGSSITVGAEDGAKKYSTEFTAGKTISPSADRWLNSDQADALKKGWEAGA